MCSGNAIESNNMKQPPNMDAEETVIFNWKYRNTGDFKRSLMEAICRADGDNLDRLKLGFPDEVNGYQKFKECSGWWKAVQEKAVVLGYITSVD